MMIGVCWLNGCDLRAWNETPYVPMTAKERRCLCRWLISHWTCSPQFFHCIRIYPANSPGKISVSAFSRSMNCINMIAHHSPLFSYENCIDISYLKPMGKPIQFSCFSVCTPSVHVRFFNADICLNTECVRRNPDSWKCNFRYWFFWLNISLLFLGQIDENK